MIEGTAREAECCCYCEGWHDPASCTAQGEDPFVDADVWEAEASRAYAQLLRDAESPEVPDCNSCYQPINPDDSYLVMPGGREVYHVEHAPAAELRAAP